MKLIMEQYGKFILSGIIIVSLFYAVFLGVSDAYGHRGLLQIMGSDMPDEKVDYSSYQDYTVMTAEAGKGSPQIRCLQNSHAVTNTEYSITELVNAADGTGTMLEVKVVKITDTPGNDVSFIYDRTAERLIFPVCGLYTFELCAVDDGNRCTRATVQIPVNKS